MCTYIIIVCTHIFTGACIHVVRYRHASYMHTYVYLLVWVHAHLFVYIRISRTTALGCRIQWQDFGSCGAVVQSRGPVVHQLAGSGCMRRLPRSLLLHCPSVNILACILASTESLANDHVDASPLASGHASICFHSFVCTHRHSCAGRRTLLRVLVEP
jgi:hypothetical protein